MRYTISDNADGVAIMFLALVLLAWAPPGICEDRDATDRASVTVFGQEAAYRAALSSDTTGDAYARLALFLFKRGDEAESLKVVTEARKKGFSDNPRVLAAGAFISRGQSLKAESYAKKDLYNEACQILCKRALKTDPHNAIARETLRLAEKDRKAYLRYASRSEPCIEYMRPSKANVEDFRRGKTKTLYGFDLQEQ